MSDETQAQALAEWLAAPPGTAPPSGLDPEVIEAVYALRPEMAPAPRVSVEDILADVVSGPVSAPDASEPVHLAEVIELGPLRREQTASRAARPSSPAANPGTERPRPTIDTPSNSTPISPRWFLGTIGGVAALAAALALFILVPALKGGVLLKPAVSDLAMVTENEKAPAPDKATTSTEAEDADFEQAEPADEMAFDLTLKANEQPSKNVAPTGGQSLQDGGVLDTIASADSDPAASMPPGEKKESLARPNPPPPSASFGNSTALPSVVRDESIASEPFPTPAAEERVASAATRAPETEMDMADDEMDLATKDSESRTRQSKPKRKAAAASREDSGRSYASSPVTLSQLANQAKPTSESPVTLLSNENAVLQSAQDYERNQNWVQAAKVYERAISTVRPIVGQKFAAASSALFLEAGRKDLAIRVANRCGALSAINTSHLSMCYYSLGQARQAAKQDSLARQAYMEAIRLNNLRD
jgi:hypothetical protein